MTDPIPSAAVRRPPVLEQIWAQLLPELSRPATPARTPEPRLIVLDEEIADELDLDPGWLRSDDGVRFLTGEARAAGAVPVAQVYAGHQWGEFRPILGDGRAALLGERRDRRGLLRDLHLKGIGPTSMSRVDGFATIGPMLREFLLSEAMHALAIPTTRALAVVSTGAPRDRDGQVLPGAVLARTARSHVRFGSFEYARAQRDPGLLRRLADHVIARSHPRAAHAEQPYRALLGEIVESTAALTADWMRVGFVHGVLSTDNVLVSAETIDYGPCAFLDAYEPGAYFSSIDAFGRYAYDRQPAIMQWNLERLAESIAPLLDDDPATGERTAAELVASFDGRYRAHRSLAFRRKLGLDESADRVEVDQLTERALAILAERAVDFTGFWRDLAAAAAGDERPVRGRFLGPVPELDAWLRRWLALGPDDALIRRTNPVYIPRNHLVDEALAAAVAGDVAPFTQLRGLLRAPFVERAGHESRRFARPAPGGAPRHRTYCGT
ncbi:MULTISPECIES: YdiU family protein [unclassified Microbacterium]|uniref:protein adenylyltransferase SelO n=1 Tax=unclassified Microbacterium TaxID=2609290 RepID=UPI003650F41F